MSIDWRISLVPAPAVIPAPGVYTNIAAVKTLVVEHRSQWCSGVDDEAQCLHCGPLKSNATPVGCYPFAVHSLHSNTEMAPSAEGLLNWFPMRRARKNDMRRVRIEGVRGCYHEQSSVPKGGQQDWPHGAVWNDKGSTNDIYSLSDLQVCWYRDFGAEGNGRVASLWVCGCDGLGVLARVWPRIPAHEAGLALNRNGRERSMLWVMYRER